MIGVYIHRPTKTCTESSYSFSVSIAVFLALRWKMRFSSHVPSRKHQVTGAQVIPKFRVLSPELASCKLQEPKIWMWFLDF